MGNTSPVKERRVLNYRIGLLGGDFDKMPVLIMSDVSYGPYRIFCFVVDATPVGLVRTAFSREQCDTGGSHCLMRVRLTWARTLF